jgi:predicted DsbA family dithiol-disulfide isomerase
MADDGEPMLEHLTKKYGASATKTFGDPNSHLAQAGRAVGIEFNNKRNIYPTVKAHALIEYVKESDNEKANLMMEELYTRYFVKGENINSAQVLTEVASKFGVDEVDSIITDEERKEKVLAKDQIFKREMRVSGVPFYIVEQNNGKRPVAFSGAQPVDMIAEVLQEALEE